MNQQYNYKRVRVVCDGIIKGCDECSTIEFSDGYCKLCGRPLWKQINEVCGFTLGYLDYLIKKQGKIDFICRNCNTIKTI